MRVEMMGQRQLVRQAVARADPAAVWAILVDSRLLPQWVPAVRQVEKCEVTGEAVGTVRHCRVELGGRGGEMVERCVSLEPQRHIAFLVDDESFGMRRMFADYGFVIALESVRPNQTRVTVETFYTPRNAAWWLMNRLAMRRVYRRVVDQLLAGLVRLAEQRSVTENALTAAPDQGRRTSLNDPVWPPGGSVRLSPARESGDRGGSGACPGAPPSAHCTVTR